MGWIPGCNVVIFVLLGGFEFGDFWFCGVWFVLFSGFFIVVIVFVLLDLGCFVYCLFTASILFVALVVVC